jgi:hypothetical protein
MGISLAEAKSICTKDEYAILQASQGPALDKLSAAELKRHAMQSRKLLDKWSDKSRSQARTSSRKAGFPDLDTRSAAKNDLFRSALQAFEGRLKTVEAAAGSSVPKPRGTSKIVRAKEARVARSSTRTTLGGVAKSLSSPSSAKSAAAPAAAAKPAKKKKAVKKAAAKVAPAATAKPAPKAAAKKVVKKAAKKTPKKSKAVARAAAAAVTRAAAVNTKSTKPSGGLHEPTSIASQQKGAIARGKGPRHTPGFSRNIAGHVSARGKRSQAKRDKKG